VSVEVIPAIDVAGGRLSRLTSSGLSPLDGAFGGDPIAAARAFVEAGARWIHVVDMDLAFSGEARNLSIVRRIAAMPVHVQASGGVLVGPSLDSMLDAGAARVVLGSAALEDVGALAPLVGRLGDRLAIGIEVDDGRISPRGRVAADMPLDETVERLATIGARRMLVTDVRRVGGLTGPDIETLHRVGRAGRCPLIASGGVATLEDVRSLLGIDRVEAAVVGRALYEGGLDLAEALAVGRSVPSAGVESPDG
jgi:phosphoribosylformimino-5-aminoimidazole carboxamide ribonucleotide (ProFAR) isomerase